eukprot:TRINITY_DN5110_c0_g1_i6.p1 TRINITY_DN5110_c0_g1~~TRINITY_DN5110_c0_g1_i6.p1  ORF type:complete len:317 (+),score=-39.49 TRINITY_DN5110_c0_g1_i6:94-951(+)
MISKLQLNTSICYRYSNVKISRLFECLKISSQYTRNEFTIVLSIDSKFYIQTNNTTHIIQQKNQFYVLVSTKLQGQHFYLVLLFITFTDPEMLKYVHILKNFGSFLKCELTYHFSQFCHSKSLNKENFFSKYVSSAKKILFLARFFVTTFFKSFHKYKIFTLIFFYFQNFSQDIIQLKYVRISIRQLCSLYPLYYYTQYACVVQILDAFNACIAKICSHLPQITMLFISTILLYPICMRCTNSRCVQCLYCQNMLASPTDNYALYIHYIIIPNNACVQKFAMRLM